MRALTPFMGLHPHDLLASQSPCLLIHWGVRISHLANVEGGQKYLVHSIYVITFPLQITKFLICIFIVFI